MLLECIGPHCTCSCRLEAADLCCMMLPVISCYPGIWPVLACTEGRACTRASGLWASLFTRGVLNWRSAFQARQCASLVLLHGWSTGSSPAVKLVPQLSTYHISCCGYLLRRSPMISLCPCVSMGGAGALYALSRSVSCQLYQVGGMVRGCVGAWAFEIQQTCLPPAQSRRTAVGPNKRTCCFGGACLHTVTVGSVMVSPESCWLSPDVRTQAS